MITTEATDQLWEKCPITIRSFIEMRPHYAKLGEEVAYILKRLLRASQIEYSTVIHRVKTIDSFFEKVARKKYNDPLKEVTDIAGVRIVFLYLVDRPQIEKLIEEEFKVIERIDKTTEAEDDRFGYCALHYLVCLGKKASGARYDDLKDLICEIQIRTILQDAWAIVAHHLSYKQESDVPKELRRKLNALSGLFETADSQFDSLRKERQIYKDKVKQQITEHEKDFLQNTINIDNLVEYLNWKLGNRKSDEEQELATLLSQLTNFKYTKLDQLDKTLNRTLNAIEAFEKEYPPIDLDTGQSGIFTQMGAVRVALKFVHEKYRKAYGFTDELSKFVSLVQQ